MKKFRGFIRGVGQNPFLVLVLVIVLSAAWLSILSNIQALPHATSDSFSPATSSLNASVKHDSKSQPTGQVEGVQTSQNSASQKPGGAGNPTPAPQPAPHPQPGPKPPIIIDPGPIPIDPPPVCKFDEASKPNLCHWPPCDPCMERICPLNESSSMPIRYPCGPCNYPPGMMIACRIDDPVQTQ